MIIHLGEKYKDTITGFKGTVTARTTYLHGCDRVCLIGVAGNDGKYATEWFDIDRVEHIENDSSRGISPLYPNKINRQSIEVS